MHTQEERGFFVRIMQGAERNFAADPANPRDVGWGGNVARAVPLRPAMRVMDARDRHGHGTGAAPRGFERNKARVKARKHRARRRRIVEFEQRGVVVAAGIDEFGPTRDLLHALRGGPQCGDAGRRDRIADAVVRGDEVRGLVAPAVVEQRACAPGQAVGAHLEQHTGNGARLALADGIARGHVLVAAVLGRDRADFAQLWVAHNDIVCVGAGGQFDLNRCLLPRKKRAKQLPRIVGG